MTSGKSDEFNRPKSVLQLLQWTKKTTQSEQQAQFELVSQTKTSGTFLNFVFLQPDGALNMKTQILKDVVCCDWTKFFGDIFEKTFDLPPFEPRQAPRTHFSIRFQRHANCPNTGQIALRLIKCNAKKQAVNVQCKLQLHRLPDGSLMVDTSVTGQFLFV